MFGFIKKVITKLFDYLSSLFLNGLFTILPIIVTISIFTTSFRILKSWLEPIDKFKPAFLEAIPHSEIILAIVLIFFLGAILKFFVLRSLVQSAESLLFKTPLVRPVYSGIKQLIQAFNIQEKLTFKKVVVLEFPRKGIYSLGFLTSQMPQEIAPEQEQRFFNVFVPTTPNPTSGYFVMLPESDISITNLTQQEAMALIISGGIIQPERFVHNKNN